MKEVNPDEWPDWAGSVHDEQALFEGVGVVQFASTAHDL